MYEITAKTLICSCKKNQEKLYTTICEMAKDFVICSLLLHDTTIQMFSIGYLILFVTDKLI